MKTAFAAVAGLILMAGCATQETALRNTLNDRSDRLSHLEDRLPPNPNRPPDNREFKSVPTVVQHDPAFNQPIDEGATRSEDKGLIVNAGPDEHVRTQDPRKAGDLPHAVGGPGETVQTGTKTSGGRLLSDRVRAALFPGNRAPNIQITSHGSMVTLSGTVTSEAERSSLEEAAGRVPGVTSVENQIVVSDAAKP